MTGMGSHFDHCDQTRNRHRATLATAARPGLLPALLLLLLLLLLLPSRAAGHLTWLRSPQSTAGGGGGGSALVLAHACENEYASGVVAAVLSARAGGWAGAIVVLTAGVGNATVAALQAAGATDVLLFDRDFYTPGGWQDPAEFSRLGFESPALCKSFGLQLKLYAFSLTTFDKLLIIDSDVVVLGNISRAMELRVTSVAGGGCQFGEMRFNEAQTKPVARHTCLINAGVMFIRPSQRAYVSLMTLWVSIQDAPHLPEQAIINMLFGHSYETKPGPQTAWKKPWSSVVRDVLHLSIERTFFDKMPCAFHVKGHFSLATEAEQRWALNNMILYHFTGGKRTKAKDVLPLYEAHALSPLGHKVFSAWLSYDRAAKRLLTGLAESV